MDHVVYLDHKAKELTNLIIGKKSMIVRGSMGRRTPYQSVKVRDELYFIENKGSQVVKAKAKEKSVFFSNKLNREDSFAMIDKYQNLLFLNTALKKRFVGKQYLTLITISDFILLEHSFELDKSEYSIKDDWLLVGKIDSVKIQQEA